MEIHHYATILASPFFFFFFIRENFFWLTHTTIHYYIKIIVHVHYILDANKNMFDYEVFSEVVQEDFFFFTKSVIISTIW